MEKDPSLPIVDEGWNLKVRGTDGVEIRCYIIPTRNIESAAEIASNVARIIIAYPHGESLYTQVTLRSWRVEVQMSAKENRWWSPDQDVFAREIAGTYPHVTTETR